MANPFITLTDPVWVEQPAGQSGQQIRMAFSDAQAAPGPVDLGSFDIYPVSGMVIGVGQGGAWVRSPLDQTLYRCSITGADGQITLDTNATSGTTRIDTVILRVYDDAVDSSGSEYANVEVIEGTPTAGATLDNRNGAPVLPTALSGATAYILLADIAVAFGAASVTTSNIRDRRPIGQKGMIPPIAINVLDDLDLVTMQPANGAAFGTVAFNGADCSGNQSAALMYLPRAGAYTKLYWGYYTATLGGGTKNFKIAITDASGMPLADTGNIVWSSAADNKVAVSLATVPYTGYVFDVGYYYVIMAHGTSFSGSDQVYGPGVLAGNPLAGSGVRYIPIAPNMFFDAPGAGLTISYNTGTFRTGALGWQDHNRTLVSNAVGCSPVPVIGLSL